MTSRTPCLAGLRPLSCSCSLTIWVASENRLAKLRTPRTYCFNAGFSGLPNGVTPQPGSAASGTVHNPGATWTDNTTCPSSESEGKNPMSRKTQKKINEFMSQEEEIDSFEDYI